MPLLWAGFQCLALAAAGVRVGRIMLGPLALSISSPDTWRFKWHRPERSCLSHYGYVGVLGDADEPTAVLMRRFRTYDIALLALAASFASSLTAVGALSAVYGFSGIEPAIGFAFATIWQGFRHLRYARWRESVRRRGIAAYDAQVARWSIVWDSLAGRRPRDWNTSRIEYVLTPGEHAAEELCTLLWSHLYWLDVSDIDQSIVYLRRAVNMAMTMPSSATRSGVLLWASFIAATYQNDDGLARRLFTQGIDRATRYEILMPLAALSLIDGEPLLARTLAERGLSWLHLSDPGTAQLDEDHYRRIIARANVAA